MFVCESQLKEHTESERTPSAKIDHEPPFSQRFHVLSSQATIGAVLLLLTVSSILKIQTEQSGIQGGGVTLFRSLWWSGCSQGTDAPPHCA
jgi:hypothetical protein